VSEGGLAVCLAEAALYSGCGATVELAEEPRELFGEIGGRAIVSCSPEDADALRGLALELDVPLRAAGVAGGATLLGVELAELRKAWEVSL
jgi:phosphoribosylformylglycinamidine (FGAM) synthase-like enzyme